MGLCPHFWNDRTDVAIAMVTGPILAVTSGDAALVARAGPDADASAAAGVACGVLATSAAPAPMPAAALSAAAAADSPDAGAVLSACFRHRECCQSLSMMHALQSNYRIQPLDQSNAADVCCRQKTLRDGMEDG